MAKLPPNFSWQKYQEEPQDSREQFQFQLQSMYNGISNSANAIIDDESFFLRERQTSFTWVNGQPIFTKTLPTSAWTAAGTSNVIPLGITSNFTVIDMVCCISDGSLFSSNTLLLPHLDVGGGGGSISIVRNGENIVLTSGGVNRSAYSGFVTVYYIKN